MDMKEELHSVIERLAERLDGAMAMMERLVSQQGLMASSAEESIARIVATVEHGATAESSASLREVELTERLAVAEKTIAELRASATVSAAHASRRTVAAGLMAKQEGGIDAASATGALDAALVSLSLEQRIAVKAQLLRAGLV